MAKLGFIGLLDPDPEKAWKEAGKKPKDNTEAVKAKVMAGIQNTISQLEKLGPNDPAPARAWFKFKGDRAQVTIKRGTSILPINGKTKNTCPRERAIDFYKGALTAVENNELKVTAEPNLLQQIEASTKRRGRPRKNG